MIREVAIVAVVGVDSELEASSGAELNVLVLVLPSRDDDIGNCAWIVDCGDCGVVFIFVVVGPFDLVVDCGGIKMPFLSYNCRKLVDRAFLWVGVAVVDGVVIVVVPDVVVMVVVVLVVVVVATVNETSCSITHSVICSVSFT